jgi:hypothetical protein
MAGAVNPNIMVVKLSNIIAALQDNLAMKADPEYWAKKDWPGAESRAWSVDRDECFEVKAYITLNKAKELLSSSAPRVDLVTLEMVGILVEKLISIMSVFYEVEYKGPLRDGSRSYYDWMDDERRRAPFRRIFSISDVIKLYAPRPDDSSGPMLMSDVIVNSMAKHIGACCQIILSYDKDFQLKIGSKSIRSIGYIRRVRELLDGLACAERDLLIPGSPISFRVLKFILDRTISMKDGLSSLLEIHAGTECEPIEDGAGDSLGDMGNEILDTPFFRLTDCVAMMGTDEQAASLAQDVDPEVKLWRHKYMPGGIGGLDQPEEVERSGGGAAAAR